MKAKMTVDPRLLRLIGDKLYSSHPLPIVVRELLQNARDACVRKGVDVRVRIAIKHYYQESPPYFLVECEDRGIGMTEEQLLDDFLCLGNTSKIDDEGAVGGFGIAKAAIMRNPEWSVHTLDNYVNQDIIFKGGDIQKAEYIDGTLITVKITDKAYTWTFREALQMIYLSDVAVELEANYEELDYSDMHAGWNGWSLTPMKLESAWDAHKLDELRINNDYISGKSVFRLAGLVQFTRQSYSNRKFNIIVDVRPQVRPDDKSYPFTLSREGITPALRIEVDPIIDEADANPVSTVTRLEAIAADPTVDIREGYTLRGRRVVPKEQDNEIMEALETIHYRDVLRMPGQETHKHQVLYFENYNQLERNLRKDYGILKLWREMIVMCAEWDDPHGIGFVINDRISAMRVTTNGYTFYVVNPDSITGSPEEQIMLLHYHACHETAHFRFNNHDEPHSIEQTQIFRDTIGEVVLRLPELKRMLREL